MADKKAEEFAEKLIKDLLEGPRKTTAIGPIPFNPFGLPMTPGPPNASPFSNYPPANSLPNDLLEWSFENGRMKITLPADKAAVYWKKLKKIMDMCVKE